MSNASSSPVKPKKQLHKRVLARVAAAPGASAPWGPGRAILGVVASFFAVQILVSIVVAIYVSLRGWDETLSNLWLSEVPVQFGIVLISEVVTLLIIWLFVRKYSWSKVKVALGLHQIAWRDIGYVILGVVLYFIAYVVFLAIAQAFLPIDVEQEQEVGFDAAQGFSGLALTFISLVILAPITEEIVFRGYLYAGLRRWLGIFGGAILTSLIFASPHLMQSTDSRLLWIAGIDTFVLSLVLCYLREKTGSIYAGIGVHAIKNGIAFLALFILS